MDSISFESKDKLEANYSKNNCFLSDNYIYENIDKIGKIPIQIVQGWYDMICVPTFAFELHEKLKYLNF